MKKVYRVDGEDWVWDTWDGRWMRPRVQRKEEEKRMAVAAMQAQSQSWHEFLKEIYKECRDMPKWEELRTMHDRPDRDFFDRMDRETGRVVLAVA